MSFSTHDEHPRTGTDHSTEELRAPQTTGEIWASILAGIGIVLGIGSLFYKPLLFGTVAVLAIVFGSIGNEGGRLAKVGVPIVAICAFVGMVMAIFVTKKPIW